ncbi:MULTISPECIES: restriction endonuclease subunit S [unclassified Lebetimonas]|uniref:restriction endonuclease subunit S n=1 Tax=unclassified Lebetimonas TaxID=2648158 RepID=UPI0004639542|nr:MULTISPECIES: restriction endonuclease subunit S [unclassified Lebetimonas]
MSEKLPNGWKRVKLGEVAVFNYGKSLPEKNRIKGNIPVYSSAGITGWHNEALVKSKGIIVGRKGTIGKVYKAKVPFYPIDTCYYILPNENYDFDFMYYLLIYLKLDELNEDSAVPGLNRNTAYSQEILLPPLPEQKAIASVLSSLDDKIDLLNRQNQTLEKMTETLFRKWFIEDAKEDWEIVSLEEIAEVKNGFAFKSKDYVEYQPEHLEVLKMGHIDKNGGLKTNPKHNYIPRDKKFEKYILNKGDIVIAMTDMKDNVVILGVPAMVDKNNHYVLNQRVARISLKDNKKLINNYLLYLQLKDKENIAILRTKANSGVQVNLTIQSIRNIDIIIPPLPLQIEKGKIIEKLYNKIEINNNQIRTLEKLRDILLPKLISGEVRMKDEG